MKDFIKKYKSIILYLFFGCCTTLVNTIVYFICATLIKLGVDLSTTIAWVLAVLFAYVTNRIFVFENKTDNIIKEMLSFFSCRLLTGLLDLGFMNLFVKVLGFNDLLIKILSNVVVTIINYVLSKLVIFKDKES